MHEEVDIDLPQRRLIEFCEQAGIRCMDLLPAFRARSTEESLYALRNTHWNEAGIRVAAELVRSYLTDEKVLDG